LATTTFRSYRDALDYLFHFTDYERMHRVTKATSVFGLSRMNKLLDHCGNPHQRLRAVHIAGTKGKGSTAAMLASILRRAGLRVGLYTSPHIYDVRERIQIDGEWIPEDAVVRWLTELRPYLDVAAKGGETYAPTFFETFTVIAFLHFLDRATDAAIFEVGLGGRLDATNVLRPVACAITPVSFDHTDKLGNTLAQIAGEKAGIVKSGVPVVSGVQQLEAMGVIRARCNERNAPLHVVGEDITLSCDQNPLECGDSFAAPKPPSSAAAPTGATPVSRAGGLDSDAFAEGDKRNTQHASPLAACGSVFGIRTWRREIEQLSTPLLGRHQRENAAVAVGLADLLCEAGIEVPDAAVRDGLASVRWPGRIQVVAENPEVIIDGAHNPASVTVLLDALAELPERRTIFVFGAAADKDIPTMLSLLAPAADAFVFTRTANPRAADTARLTGILAQLGVRAPADAAPTPAEALDRARSLAAAADRIVVCGSMYLAGDLLAQLSPADDGT
jgi:dihydrofolate synthase/folylpolyglutamate synthase